MSLKIKKKCLIHIFVIFRWYGYMDWGNNRFHEIAKMIRVLYNSGYLKIGKYALYLYQMVTQNILRS